MGETSSSQDLIVAQDAGFEVVVDTGGGQVRGGDEQYFPVGDDELGVLFRFGAGSSGCGPAPQLGTGHGEEGHGAFSARDGTARPDEHLHDDADPDAASCGSDERVDDRLVGRPSTSSA